MSQTVLTNAGAILLAKMLSCDQLAYTRAVASSATVEDAEFLTELPAIKQTSHFIGAEQHDNYAKLTTVFSCRDLESSYQLRSLGVYAKIAGQAQDVLYKVVIYDDTDESVTLPATQNIEFRFVFIDAVAQGGLTVSVEEGAAAPYDHIPNVNRHLFTQLNTSTPALVDSGECASFEDGQKIVFVPKVALSEASLSFSGLEYPLTVVNLAGQEVSYVLVPHKSYVLTYRAEQGDFCYVKHNEIEYVEGVGHYWNGEAWQTTIAAGTIISRLSVEAPAGTLLCDGSSLAREEYPELFASLGTRFGYADVQHFNLPNLAGRCLIGAGPEYSLGSVGGEVTHTLTSHEMPSHTHTANATLTGGSHTHTATLSIVSDGGHKHISGVVDDTTRNFYYDVTTLRDAKHYAIAGDQDQESPVYSGYTSTVAAHSHSGSAVTLNSTAPKLSCAVSVGSVGNSGTHNNMQPYMAAFYFIYTGRPLL